MRALWRKDEQELWIYTDQCKARVEYKVGRLFRVESDVEFALHQLGFGIDGVWRPVGAGDFEATLNRS